MSNYIPISEYLANAVGAAMDPEVPTTRAAALATCAVGCSGVTCQTCQNCEGGCSGSCESTCKGSCSSGCYGGCESTCKGTCASGCVGNCSKSCTSGCESYCTSICQRYCELQQTFSANTGKNRPSGMGTTFNKWNFSKDDTISISANDWNTLASYIKAAGPYCGGGTLSILPAENGQYITVGIFNSINDALDKIGNAPGRVTKDDYIISQEINALQSGYNSAQIASTLPSSGYNSCCQKGMSCMTQASGRPSLQPCNQSVPCISEEH